MEVVNAFKSTENYLTFFTQVDEARLEYQKCYQEILAGLEKKFLELINDNPHELEDFLVPEPPKMKEPKEKRISYATKRTWLGNVKSTQTLESLTMSPILRRSSRCASKALRSSHCISKASCNYKSIVPSVSAIDPIFKVKKEPIAKVEEIQTPVSELKGPVKVDSVKKRIEEFEKRTQAAVSASKVPTADESVEGLLCTEHETSVTRGRCTRNKSQVLQEKNTNIKMIKEKGQEAQKKKDVIIKTSVEETKRRREERARKVAAHREAVEKEKEMKLRMIQKQKDEKLRTETLRKKHLAAIKAGDNEGKRNKEETAKLMKPKEESKTKFCDYGIEHVLDGASSDDEEKPKNQIPPWATKENRKHQLCVQVWLDKKKTVYPWLFNKKLKYPKVTELFSAGVEMRPRTSSAFWNSQVCFDESFPFSIYQ